MRVARAVDAAPRDPREAAFARIATAIGKYWICKRAPAFVNEAQECLGGNGYVEESILPRLYRQAPLNSIWEGSGNIQCLDVLRALAKEPETGAALWNELQSTGSDDADYASAVERLRAPLTGHVRVEEAGARTLVEQLALALQAQRAAARRQSRRRSVLPQSAGRTRTDWRSGRLHAGIDPGRS